MRIKTLLILIPAVVLALASCRKHSPEIPKIPINIATSVTKITDTAFEANDAVGLYVVNTPSALKQSGNHADNVKFTSNGEKWVTSNQLYWYDDKTPADFYTYYPYKASASVSAMSFSVQQDQSSESGYKASEFLYGSKKSVAPTAEPVLINTRHLMSCIRVELKAGTGWTDSDIAAASVSISGLQTAAKLNLSDGSISAAGNVADIQPLSFGGGVYKALVVPQTVTDSELIRVKVGGNDYALKTSVTLVAGKQHKCSIVVNRTSEGINIGIDPWEDGDEFGGTVE
jgi:hypothetical protein